MSKQLEMPLEESLQREEGLKTNDHLNTSQYLGIAQHPKYFTSQALHNTFIQNLASFLAEHTKTLFSPPLFCLLNMNTGILQLITFLWKLSQNILEKNQVWTTAL